LRQERLAEAAAAYREAAAARSRTGDSGKNFAALAGLAAVALAQGKLAAAKAQVEEILLDLEDRPVEGGGEPFRIYLICLRVLQADGDPRADLVLERASHLMQEQVEKIQDDELVRSFLHRVPAHRALVGEWEKGAQRDTDQPWLRSPGTM